MNINNRLKCIADFVDVHESIIDIGCDHAFLCIYLVNTKKNIKTIATDINKGPLDIAKKNISNYGLIDKIKTKLGDGLDPIEDEIDTVIISGMGGETIKKIIERGQNKLKNVKKIIISPNNEFYIVRKTVTSLGYKISKEIIIKDKKHYYPIIVFEKGKKDYTEEELTYGPILLKEKEHEFIEYYTFIKKNLMSFYDDLPDTDKKRTKEEIEELDKIIGN